MCDINLERGAAKDRPSSLGLHGGAGGEAHPPSVCHVPSVVIMLTLKNRSHVLLLQQQCGEKGLWEQQQGLAVDEEKPACLQSVFCPKGFFTIFIRAVLQ